MRLARPNSNVRHERGGPYVALVGNVLPKPWVIIRQLVEHLRIPMCALVECVLEATWETLRKLPQATLLQKMVDDHTKVSFILLFLCTRN